MREVLITSTVLIPVMALLRYLLRGRISLRLQYALWLVVAARLLIPVSLPGSRVSVLNVLPQASREAALPRWEGTAPLLPQQPVQPVDQEPVQGLVPAENDPVTAPNQSDPDPAVPVQPAPAGTASLPQAASPAVDWGQVLTAVWLCGVGVMGVWLFCMNLFFRRHVKRGAKPLAMEGCPVPVYVSGAVTSPCLVGILRPAVYVTPDCAGDTRRLRHVLAHELTHLRHGDPVWALVRGVCLCLYWFDPLVWWAADLSRRDCELACDEGTIRKLGEEERLAYGRTLVDMAAVSASPGRLLQTATTMTDRKEGIMERVKLIAKKPRVAAAAVALAVLVTLVTAACTFTGAKTDPEPTGSPTQSQAPGASQTPGPGESPSRPLSGEELRWFNEQFFNSSGANQSQLFATWGDGTREYYNLRNQFANPLNLYDRPEDIDLGELLYCEGSAPSDEELGIIWDGDPGDLPCPAFKLTTAEIDEILKVNTGLTLEETDRVNLTGTYDEATDAYYWMHGDTNYCGELDFLYGVREGDAVKLYHGDGDSWYCVSLEAREDGTYWFVSNQVCGRPAIPPVLPSGEPAVTISLKDLEPYAAEAVTVEAHPGHYSFNYETCYANWDINGHHIMVYRAADGEIYAAYVVDDVYYVFLSGLSEDRGCVFFYNDLFGHDGFYVRYYGATPGDYYNGGEGASYGTIYEYFYFDENDVLTRLLRCPWPSPAQLDLDGDGTDELVFNGGFFFQRDGLVYQAGLKELLLDACPELNYWDQDAWDPYGRFLYANGLTDWDSERGAAMWERYLYFDGENILVYNPTRTATDHVVDGAAARVPHEVVEQAKAQVEKFLVQQPDGTWVHSGLGAEEELNYVMDDWRIESFHGPYTYRFGDATVEGWGFNYEKHTTQPEKVTWAGGLYVTEDGWVSPGYPGCDYLFFQRGADGSLTFLWPGFYQESMDSIYVNRSLLRDMETLEISVSPTSYAALEFQLTLKSITYGGPVLLTCSDPNGGGGAVTAELNTPAAVKCLEGLRSDEVTWSRAEAPDREPAGANVILSDTDWYELIQVWADSGLVKAQHRDQEAKWYQVSGAREDLPYTQLRSWFDEAYAG